MKQGFHLDLFIFILVSSVSNVYLTLYTVVHEIRCIISSYGSWATGPGPQPQSTALVPRVVKLYLSFADSV